MINFDDLSHREKEIAALLLQGKSNKQIAQALNISVSTVEFHLTRLYKKLRVSARPEAMLRLSHLWKTRGEGVGRPTRGGQNASGGNLGESPVENTGIWMDNQDNQLLSMEELLDMSPHKKSFFAKFKMPLAVGILLILAAVVAGLLLLRSTDKPYYERECEYPDAHTTGQTISRSNASGSSVHGQFGAAPESPWPAQAGTASYRNISLPQIEALYLKVLYSKNSPASMPILVYLDDAPDPRASFIPRDQENWNLFQWSEPIYLGSIDAGVHSLQFATDGQQYGVVDLDQFVLIAGTTP